MAGVADTEPPFALSLYGGQTFPNRSGWAPWIAWAGVSGERHQLNLLQEAVSYAMDTLGYAPPECPFVPHVMVGWFDTDDRGWCLEMWDYWRNMLRSPTEAFPVNEIVLYASEREDDGRVAYVIQDRWALIADLLG